VHVTFAGSPARIEARLVPEAGFELDPFEVSGLPRWPGIALLRALAQAGGAVHACGRILARLIGAEAVRSLKYFRFTQHDSMVIGRLGYSGELGYELLAPASAGEELRHGLLKHEEVRPCGWEAANSLRIEAGYVLFDCEIDGRANPRELGLERLVNEPHLRFSLTRKLAGFEILEAESGGEVEAATVTSECFSPMLGKRIALGYAPPQMREGSAVRLADRRTARVTRLPFYDPQRRRPRDNPL
jgi:aminomethyltransferase